MRRLSWTVDELVSIMAALATDATDDERRILGRLALALGVDPSHLAQPWRDDASVQAERAWGALETVSKR